MNLVSTGESSKLMAEREGFEPSELVRVHLISNQAHSANSGTSPKERIGYALCKNFQTSSASTPRYSAQGYPHITPKTQAFGVGKE